MEKAKLIVIKNQRFIKTIVNKNVGGHRRHGSVELNKTILLHYETLRPQSRFDRLRVDNKSNILIKLAFV